MKRSIGIILCISIIACLFALSASATETYTYEVGEGKTYETIQQAVDAVAAQTVTQPTEFIINIAAGEYSGVTKLKQQTNNNVSFIGESAASVKLSGSGTTYYRDGKAGANCYAILMIDGDARSAGTESVLIKNITFSYTLPENPLTGVTWVDAISLTRIDNVKNFSYSHNITVEGCVFNDSAQAVTLVGLRSWSCSYNVTIKDSSAAYVHSFGQGQCYGYTILNCTEANGKCAFNFQSSKDVLVDSCDFGVCVDEVLRMGQSKTTAMVETTAVFRNIKGSYLSEDPARGFLVIRGGAPKEITLEDSVISGNILCEAETTPAIVAQLSIDLNNNYWSEEVPDFSTKIIGFDAGGVTQAMTPTTFFTDNALETLNTDCDYVGHHTYEDNWYVTVEPTCCCVGEERRDCTNERCTDETAFETREVAATGEHTYSEAYTFVSAPTCMTTGEERAYCTGEGCTAYISREIPIDPNAHDMGVWAINIHETCSEVGYNRRYCRNEGCTYYEETERGVCSHSYTVLDEILQQPTCIAAGVARYRCSMCELTEIRSYGAPTGQHAWGEWTLTKQATITEDGSETRCCTTPGCTACETRLIPKTGTTGFFDWLINFFNELTRFLNDLFAKLGF